VTGKLDAFEWVTPSGMPDSDIGDVIEDAMFEAPALAPVSPRSQDAVVIEPVETEPATPVRMTDSNEGVGKSSVAEDSDVQKTDAETPVEGATPASADARTGVEGTTDDVAVSPSVHELPDTLQPDKAAEESNRAKEPVDEPPAPEPPAPEPADKVEVAGDASSGIAPDAEQKPDQDLDKPIAFPFSRMPDDPGPDEDEDKPKETRPRFFN